MPNWLNTLVSGLAGAGAAGTEYLTQKRQREDDLARQKKDEEFRQLQMDLSRAQFDALQNDRERGYAKEAWEMESPDTDLTANPNLAKYRQYGFGLKETPALPAPRVSNSMTLPSMPSSTPVFDLGGAPSTPMTGGKYDPNADETPDMASPGGLPGPLPMGGPITVDTPTYGLGTPGKVTRAETRQEALERVDRENELKMLTEQLPGIAPQFRPLILASINALKTGGKPQITDSILMQMIAASQPKPPAASTQPDFEFANAFEIANRKAYDPLTATPAERRKAADELARQKLAGQRPPQGSGGGTPSNAEALANVVMENPGFFDTLTPTERAKIAPILQARGFKDFGRPMDSVSMRRVAETAVARTGLQELRAMLAENEQYLGPISGLQQYNPWSGAKTVRAKVDLVRQRVGKALEGGVLRKEDEQKYKNILATLWDVPELAINKVDMLLVDIDNEIKAFADAQRAGGRRTSTGDSTVPGSQPEAQFGPTIETEIAKGVAEGYSRDEVIAYLKKIGRIK